MSVNSICILQCTYVIHEDNLVIASLLVLGVDGNGKLMAGLDRDLMQEDFSFTARLS